MYKNPDLDPTDIDVVNDFNKRPDVTLYRAGTVAELVPNAKTDWSRNYLTNLSHSLERKRKNANMPYRSVDRVGEYIYTNVELD